MFELTLSKQQLLTPLLMVAGAIDKKQSVAILTHVLIHLSPQKLSLTATDLEIEITAIVSCERAEHGATTAPAKKMVDIIRSLEDNAEITLSFSAETLTIKQGRSRFKMATLPADNYPNSEEEINQIELTFARSDLVHLLQATQFAMSQQDVRIFLNGLLLEFDGQTITAVATDGHRMAICRLPCVVNNSPQPQRFLLPRKGVQEIVRLLNTITDERVSIAIGKNHFKLSCQLFTFVTKLIEARFPSYIKAIPKHQDKQVMITGEKLRRALNRIVILANEKSRAVLLHIQHNQLTLIANNQEQEEAVESLEAETQGEELKIGVNASYLLDVLTYFSDGVLCLSFSTSDSSILVTSLQQPHYQYIIMPMKI